MLRRTILLAMVGLAVAATPALASCHWYAQMKNGSATTSRALGKCSVRPGDHHGFVWVTCPSHRSATLTYVFASTDKVKGQPRAGIAAWGDAKVGSAVTVTGSSIRVTVTVSGAGTTEVAFVSVGYYAD
jgi:hypothetical protein